MTLKKILFVINHKSGENNKVDYQKIISESAQAYNFSFTIYLMDGDEVVRDIQQHIKQLQPDIIGAVGGDGTVNLIASIIQNTNIQLLIVPMGSANGMSKELQLPNSFKDCLELINTGEAVKIDLLKINDDISIHLSDVGLNAKIVKRFQLDKKRGLLTYAKHLFFEIFVLQAKNFTITADGNKYKVRAVSLTFANATKYGTGAFINPEGILNDGLFEICIVKPFPRYQLIKIAYQMFRKTLKYSEFFKVISCKQATIKTSKPTVLQVDGEVKGKVKEIKLENLPSVINVIINSKLTHPSIIH